MYNVGSSYELYYENYIDRDIREFKLECSIGGRKIEQSDIASISIEYDLMSGAEEYTIGNLAAAKLTIVVSNNIGNVYETNPIDLTVSLKARDNNGLEVWIPVKLGRFYIFEVSHTILSKTITAYDSLYQIKLERTYKSTLAYTTTVYEILDEICPLLNISYDSSIPNQSIERPEVVTETILNSNGKYEVVVSESDQVCLDMKVGQALMCIASYLGGNFIVDGNSVLKLIKYPTEITKSLNSNRYATPTIGLASYNVNQINCTTYPDNVIIVGYDENSSCMELENPFMDKTRLLSILNELNDINYHQARVRIKGDPRLELGDLIEITQTDSYGNILSRQQIPILRMTFSYTGGCSNEIESPCKAITEKAINYKGTISSRIDSLESSVSAIGSETQKLHQSIEALKTVKNYMDDMNTFVEEQIVEDLESSTMSSSRLNLYNSIVNKIKESNAAFEEEYEEIYNNKYLQ